MGNPSSGKLISASEDKIRGNHLLFTCVLPNCAQGPGYQGAIPGENNPTGSCTWTLRLRNTAFFIFFFYSASLQCKTRATVPQCAMDVGLWYQHIHLTTGIYPWSQKQLFFNFW